MTSGPGPAPPTSPQQGMVADRGSTVRLYRHPDGARPKRASEYCLLAPAGPAVNPAAAKTQVCGDGHVATMGEGDQDERETDMGDRTRQHTLLVRGQPEDADE